jgi:hypothetical protein
MRYFRERLRRIPNLYLAICVAVVDVVIVAGGIPFELCCQRVAQQHSGNVPLLLGILAGNLGMLALVIVGMIASTVLMGRGAFGLGRLLRRRVPVPVAVRAKQPRY